MSSPTKKLNAGTTKGADKAATHLDALTRAYGRCLRAAGRRAAARFRQTETVLASANPPDKWAIPPTGSLIDTDELAADTKRKTARLHNLMLTVSAQTALTPFGISFDIHAPTSQSILDGITERITDTIESAIAEQITEAVAKGYENGDSVAKVSAAIQTATDSISRPRADMLARSDLNSISNAGSLLAASTSGAATTKTWQATLDDRTRETHADADGQTVAIDDAFDVGDEQLQYPGDPDGDWSETASCRCTLIWNQPLGDSVLASSEPPTDTVTSGGNMPDITVKDDDGKSWDGWIVPSLTAAASGDTALPLSERDRAWDSGEATARVKKWASSDGSGDPDKIDYKKLGRAYFWQDTAGSDGPAIGDFKFPFGDIIGGKLTAVWRGVTAGAARLSSAKGVDEASIQKKMSAYYTKAAKQYADDSIKPPWASDGASANGEQLAAIKAHLADHGADILDDDELRAIILATQFTTKPVTVELTDFALLAATTEGTPWTATLCVAGEPTVDSGIKRILDVDGGAWLPLPLPLGLMDDTPHADVVTSSPMCGRIDMIAMAGNVCQASGIFFDQASDQNLADAGSKAASLVGEMQRMGISVDLVDTQVEMMVWNDNGTEELDDANDPVADGDGYDMPDDDMDTVEVEPDGDEPEYIMCFKRWVIAGATIVPVQALTNATISLVASAMEGKGQWRTVTDFHLPGLTAAAAGIVPLEPPAKWFDDPKFTEPTPLTITDEGRVYGHLAAWDTCHTGRPGCVPPPRSPTGYMNFHLGEVKTAEGTRVAVGTLTFDAPHASLRATASQTVRHYDDTATAGAHVRAGEDTYGIWLAGALNPRLSAEEARTLMAAPPSGDWRQVNKGEGIDLVGAHAVNQPGFIVHRPAERRGLELAASADCGCEDETLARNLAVLAASADGIDGLAELVA